MKKLNADVAEIVHSKQMAGKWKELGIAPMAGSLEQTSAFIASEQVSLETVDSNQVRASVASGRLDIGITMRQVDTAGTDVEPLVQVGAVCVMARAHHLAKKKAIHAKDLDGQAFVAAGPHDSMRAIVESTLAQEGARPVVVAESTYAITTCLLVLQGIGVGVVSPLIVPPLIKAGLVVRPFLPLVPVELILLTPLGQPPSRIAQAFMAQLRHSCSNLTSSSGRAGPS